MEHSELISLVRALESHGCALVIEWESGITYGRNMTMRGGVTAVARKELWPTRAHRYRYDVIRANQPTLNSALALLAASVDEADWQDDEAAVSAFAKQAMQRKQETGDAGVTFKALREAFLPDGVEGPTIVYETGYVTVTATEAKILRADPDTWGEVSEEELKEEQVDATIQS